VQLPLTFNGQRFKMEPINLLQMAFKNNVQVFYAQTSVPIQVVMGEDGKVDPPTYMKFWQEVRAAVRGAQDSAPWGCLMRPRSRPLKVLSREQNPAEHKATVGGVNPSKLQSLATVLAQHNIFVSGSRSANGVDTHFTSVKLGGFFTVLLQLDVVAAQATVYITARSNVAELLKPTVDAAEAVLRS